MILVTLLYYLLFSIFNKNERFHGKECKKSICYLLFSISNENENAMDNLKLWKFKLLKKSVFWTDLNVLVTLNPHDRHAACKIWQIELKK